jgi:uncharacterized protein (DUF1330 family)
MNTNADSPIYILHALWFNKSDGPSRYQQYLEVASPIAEKYGAKRVDSLIPLEIIQGDFRPDYIFTVQWPDEEAFNRFIRDPQYRAVAHMREEACTKRVLLKCKKPSTTGRNGG